MNTKYDYGKQRIINRHDHEKNRKGNNGKITSIKPMRNTIDDMIQFNDTCKTLREAALKFPSVKFQAEINNMKESDFLEIQEALGFYPEFTDQSDMFFYSVAVNAVVIGHRTV